MKTNLWILVCLLPFAIAATPDSGIFHQGGFLSARDLAQKEGKIQLLEFYAEWCTPCQHMNQTTFRDENVRQYLQHHYVSVKIDIDQFDGFALKDEFKVRYLPTIVLLDESGQMIGKIEEVLGPETFIQRLESITQTSNTLSNSPEQQKRIPTHSQKDDLQSVILQFGVFASYDNAETLMMAVATVLPSDPEIKVEKNNQQTLYKVQYGPFNEAKEAEMLKEELEVLGYKCYIKPLE